MFRGAERHVKSKYTPVTTCGDSSRNTRRLRRACCSGTPGKWKNAPVRTAVIVFPVSYTFWFCGNRRLPTVYTAYRKPNRKQRPRAVDASDLETRYASACGIGVVVVTESFRFSPVDDRPTACVTPTNGA